MLIVESHPAIELEHQQIPTVQLPKTGIPNCRTSFNGEMAVSMRSEFLLNDVDSPERLIPEQIVRLFKDDFQFSAVRVATSKGPLCSQGSLITRLAQDSLDWCPWQ